MACARGEGSSGVSEQSHASIAINGANAHMESAVTIVVRRLRDSTIVALNVRCRIHELVSSALVDNAVREPSFSSSARARRQVDERRRRTAPDRVARRVATKGAERGPQAALECKRPRKRDRQQEWRSQQRARPDGAQERAQPARWAPVFIVPDTPSVRATAADPFAGRDDKRVRRRVRGKGDRARGGPHHLETENDEIGGGGGEGQLQPAAVPDKEAEGRAHGTALRTSRWPLDVLARDSQRPGNCLPFMNVFAFAAQPPSRALP